MSSIKVIENKISSVKKYLKILQRYKEYKKEEIEGNIDLRGAVERYLYLAVQAAIDLAEAVIAHKLPSGKVKAHLIYDTGEESMVTARALMLLRETSGIYKHIQPDGESS